MRKIAALVVVIVIGGMLAPAAAQDGIQPFQRLLLLIAETNNTSIIAGYGDIYSWEPGETALYRETTYGYNDAPVMSPDGTKAVYLSVASSYIEAWLSGNDLTQGMGPLPTNIWMIYLTLPLDDPLRFIRIADQTTGLPPGSDMVRRSRPVWSPDSALVAWLEQDVTTESFSGRVVIYDTRTGLSQVARQGISLGFADGGMWSVPDLIGWGSHIAHASANAGVYPDQGGAGFGITLDLIGVDGSVAKRPVSYFANFEDQVTDIRWLLHNGQWRVGLAYPNLGWVLFDPTTEAYELLQNLPFARGVPDISWTAKPAASGLDWYTPDGTLTITGDDANYTFAPSGVPFWVTPESRVGTFGDPAMPVIPPSIRVLDLVWMPDTWQTDGIATPIQPSIAVFSLAP